MINTELKSRVTNLIAIGLAAPAALAAGCAASRPQQVQTDYAVPKHAAASAPAPAAPAPAAPVETVAHDPAAMAPGAEACADPAAVQTAGATAAARPVNKPAKINEVPKEYLHFTAARVHAGEVAPDFTLPLVDGEGQVTLSSLRDKPTVIVFGSLTCDRFRASAPEVVRLYNDFSDTVNFLFVYVREAHASDEWVREVNEFVGIQIPQPVELSERSGVAKTCVNRLKLPFTTVVDDMDDAVSITYGAWPERLYIIDTDGTIAYMGAVGPAGFLPSEVRANLKSTWQLTARSMN